MINKKGNKNNVDHFIKVSENLKAPFQTARPGTNSVDQDQTASDGVV